MSKVRSEQLLQYLLTVRDGRSERRLVPNYKNNGRVWYLRPVNSHFVYNLRLRWNILGHICYDEMATFFYLRYFSRIRFVADKWSEIGYLFDLTWRTQFAKQRRLAVYVDTRLVGRTIKQFSSIRKEWNFGAITQGKTTQTLKRSAKSVDKKRTKRGTNSMVSNDKRNIKLLK